MTTPNHQPALLEMRCVSKRYPGVRALDRVDFTLRRGEVHALLGENGAGKSTLIRVLGGAERRDEGHVRLDGVPIQPASPRAAEALGISTVHQEISLIPRLSIAENICLGREPTRFGLIRWRAVRRRAAAALSRLGLHVDPQRELAACSVAVRQMVAIARALDTQARLIVLDEPTSSLDSGETAELLALMRRLRAGGLGIVFITHFLDQVYEVADRLTVLRDGRRVGEFETRALTRHELIGHMLGKPPAQAPRRSDHAAPTTPDSPLVEARGLARRGMLSPTDLQLRPAQTVGLAGLLGSGRTELAQLLFGAVRADRGEVRVRGRRVALRSPRDAIRSGFGFTPEDRKTCGLAGSLSVRENIILALQARRGVWRSLSRRAQADLVARFMRALGIRAAGPEQPVGTLSGGNQQKVLLARWLALEPRLLILDEPTRGIDIGAKAEIRAIVAELCAQGVAVLLISSDLEEIVAACGRVVVMRDRAKVGELSGSDVSEHAIAQTIAAAGHAQ